MNSTAHALDFGLEDITKRFGGLTAVSQVNLSLLDQPMAGLNPSETTC